MKRIRSLGKLEQAVYDEQYKFIVVEFGKRAAKMANYGWGVDCSDDGISVATKVYGYGVLTTNAYLGNTVNDFEHDFQ